MLALCLTSSNSTKKIQTVPKDHQTIRQSRHAHKAVSTQHQIVQRMIALCLTSSNSTKKIQTVPKDHQTIRQSRHAHKTVSML